MIGQVLFNQGRLSQAVPLLQQAVEVLDPTDNWREWSTAAQLCAGAVAFRENYSVGLAALVAMKSSSRPPAPTPSTNRPPES